jgi:hypothetical protein
VIATPAWIPLAPRPPGPPGTPRSGVAVAYPATRPGLASLRIHTSPPPPFACASYPAVGCRRRSATSMPISFPATGAAASPSAAASPQAPTVSSGPAPPLNVGSGFGFGGGAAVQGNSSVFGKYLVSNWVITVARLDYMFHFGPLSPTASATNILCASARRYCTWYICRADPSRTEYFRMVTWIPSHVLHSSRATSIVESCSSDGRVPPGSEGLRGDVYRTWSWQPSPRRRLGGCSWRRR